MKKLMYAMLSTPLLLGALACENRGAERGEALEERGEVIEERQEEGVFEEEPLQEQEGIMGNEEPLEDQEVFDE